MYQQLISPEQLSQIITLPELVILDASIPPIIGMSTPLYSWPETIINSTRRFDINNQFSDLHNPLPHTMPTEQQFNAQAQQLGINYNSQIVVYDHFGVFSSARAWWMFKAMGHHNVAVLNGGLPAWLKAGFETVKMVEKPDYKLGDFNGAFDKNYFCDAKQVFLMLKQNSSQVLDARSPTRFLGQEAEPRAGVRSGHMPNAKNLHYKSLQIEGNLVNIEQLQQCFQQVNIENKPLAMSCGSGVTACVLALAADILGYKNIQVYDGSWSEWGADPQLPIETQPIKIS